MDASLFISRRLRFKGNIAMMCIVISFLVMIIAVAVSSGFRHEIRRGLSSVSGDIQILPPDMNFLDRMHPIESNPSYLTQILETEGVESVTPVIWRAGIVKCDDEIYGVLVKAVPDSVPMAVSIPRGLSEKSGLKPGDRMMTYFVSDKVQVRQFNVSEVYDEMVMTDDRMVVYANISDLRRLSGWNEEQASSLEILLDSGHKDEHQIRELTQEVGTYINAYSSESEAPVIAVSSLSRYPQIFSWLDLIDFNVFFILLLMTIVAGFNMISGLLIMIFENISTIGLLKSLGMTDRSISKTFISSAAVLMFKGMLVGNALALAFCIIQDTTKLLRLNPENYFVSYVPVHLDFGMIFAADLISFAVIMLLLLIPCVFISRIDPAETVRQK